MAEITIQEQLWQNLVKEARRRRKKPEELADAVLREYFERLADEELLEKSSRAAQATSFRASETEEIIRQFRKRKKKT
jgi:hypothetical protein